MNNEVLNFEYNGNIIPFAFTGNDVMINATEIVKCFPGKKISHFLSNQQTKDLIKQLESEVGIPASQLVVIVKGNYSSGIKQGTWLHRKLAIALSMWCSPAFYSWCLGKLDEIITRGYAFRDMEIAKLQGEVNNLNFVIQSQKPQVDYYNRFLSTSEMTYSMIDVVKGCNLRVSHKAVYRLLEDNGFIMRQGKRWYLKSPWSNFGYTKVLPVEIKDSLGNTVIKNKIVWTEAGRHWICSIAKELGVI